MNDQNDLSYFAKQKKLLFHSFCNLILNNNSLFQLRFYFYFLFDKKFKKISYQAKKD
jgi:hypothetical protein